MPYLGISDCLAYIRDISIMTQTRIEKITQTSGIVNLSEDLDYPTKIRKSNSLTIYPEIVESPMSYEITKRGRIPKDRTKLLMSVNCNIVFTKPIDGYEIEGEHICLM